MYVVYTHIQQTDKKSNEDRKSERDKGQKRAQVGEYK